MQEGDKARLLTEISRMNREQIRFRKQATRFFDSHASTELLDLPRPTGVIHMSFFFPNRM